MIFSKKAQSTLEFSILLIVVIAALITMQAYVKRGFQGRWKSSIDDFGEQYDPRLINSDINYSIVSNSFTLIQTVKDKGGYWTQRIDNTDSITKTNGTTAVGSEF